MPMTKADVETPAPSRSPQVPDVKELAQTRPRRGQPSRAPIGMHSAPLPASAGASVRAEKSGTLQRSLGNTRVNRMVQRKCACGGETGADGECAACKAKRLNVQRALDGGGGSSLSGHGRASMEKAFGTDLGHVRVHTGATAARAAKDLNAAAFTSGQNIYFGEGRYQPETPEGERLLAHEVTHTMQQPRGGGAVARASLSVSHPAEPAEREAETIANRVVARRSDTAMPTPAHEEGAGGAARDMRARDTNVAAVQRELAPPAPPLNCGPGTSDPFCLGLPGENEPCKPFDTLDHALSVWADLSRKIPALTMAATGCREVGPVWDAYFAANSPSFAFSSPESCVVTGAQTDPTGSAAANRAADGHLKDIVDNLPVTLRSVSPFFFNFGGPLAELRLPLEDTIGPHGPQFLHPNIVYNNAFNAAANIAGAVGTGGEGSDIFGDDDRVIGGLVVIDVNEIDPTTGAMSGEVRWVPHIHVKDTVDFCPGNLGNAIQLQFTVPMSKLEAMGLTRDVPITIDYDIGLRTARFKNVQPLIGPLPKPSPGPAPGPGPGPGPAPPNTFPRSGSAKTTGSLLRVRTGPGLNFPALRLLGDRGTPIDVITQVRGDSVDGNDVWNKIADGFVSDRFVAFDAQ